MESVTQSLGNVAISYTIPVILIKVPIQNQMLLQKQQSSGIERRRGRRRIM